MKRIGLIVLLFLSVQAFSQMKANVTSNTTTSDFVSLTWTAASQGSGVVVTGYNIYRGTVAGGENYTAPINGSTVITGTAYTDSTVLSGTTYYYTAESYCPTCKTTLSPPSNEVQASIPGGQPLPPVMNTPVAQ